MLTPQNTGITRHANFKGAWRRCSALNVGGFSFSIHRRQHRGEEDEEEEEEE